MIQNCVPAAVVLTRMLVNRNAKGHSNKLSNYTILDGARLPSQQKVTPIKNECNAH